LTGQVIAAIGKFDGKKFKAKEIIFPSQIRTNTPKFFKNINPDLITIKDELIHPLKYYLTKDKKSKFVAFVSGLNVNSQTGQMDLNNLK